ncbi:valyl-tRNA synthetase, putative [Babesia bigemina]|uniref:valine--tRNA ligase n=1 Tax=Babesia bigemina TaxID=5866 RepID=A0A061D7X4_BABBI|nr:valyl-tRNA synthetase, putative [Babesia bigemina]CDR96648.1 valyl-tRNA synthetase, putative [Babesia bigemina]|eukprot:XP_012768834.1 valyl-tRNA synthetase, putative [Babesia bigemina]
MVPKKTLGELQSAYDPKAVEEGWYDWWSSQGLFTPSSESEPNAKGRWVAVLPPPNVTGKLHIGHALTVSIQDCLARWHRMRGDTTLWIPGTDHAGIATQTVVERMLMQTENKNRHDFSRVDFVKRVFEWNDQYGSNIKTQLKRMGASLDWTRDAFTMDAVRSKAVIEAFVRMYRDGLIYRATRLVSWCPHLSTALSDIEVDTFEVTAPVRIKLPGYDSTVEVGSLWIFKYQVKGADPEKHISVATTRIETMLGDVGVAVHPNDARYRDLVGCELVHPFIPDRKLVVVADEHVDPEYGTGAVKLTPSHDKNDYDIAKRHGLPFVTIFTDDGRINRNGGEFEGMHRFECRKVIEGRLKEMGVLEDKVPNSKPMTIPRCSRTGDIVEYMIIPQWYVNCQELAARAMEHVRTGELTLIPSSYVSVWEMWLGNIQDWCISRQLWWGHRIPAYRVVSAELNGEEPWIIAHDQAEAEELARRQYPSLTSFELKQDEDVLDTWFSSGLFPLSTLGWPDEQHPDFLKFFPTTLLETGNDIIFFWVARMVMMSLHLMGKLPFSKVYLHPLVRDARGEKMSKSKGNVLDPLEVIEGTTLESLNEKITNSSLPAGEIKKAIALQKQQFPQGIPACGTDALRLGLLSLTRQNRAILLDVNKIISCRHFGNKIWNALKFAMPKIQGLRVDMGTVPSTLQWEDRWILLKLNEYIAKVTEAFENYQFGDAVQAAYDFWLYQLCDVYLEVVKPRLPSFKDVAEVGPVVEGAIYALNSSFSVGLRLLHPIMPYITEELYHHLPEHLRTSDSICVAEFPTVQSAWEDASVDGEMQLLKSAVHSLRSLAVTLGIPPSVAKTGFLVATDPRDSGVLATLSPHAATLAKFERVSVVSAGAPELAQCVQDVSSSYVSYVQVDSSMDLSKTTAKLSAKLQKSRQSLQGYQKKLTAPDYESKVPESVRELNAAKIQELELEISQLERAIAELERLRI